VAKNITNSDYCNAETLNASRGSMQQHFNLGHIATLWATLTNQPNSIHHLHRVDELGRQDVQRLLAGRRQ
jgi:hypothetical protein